MDPRIVVCCKFYHFIFWIFSIIFFMDFNLTRHDPKAVPDHPNVGHIHLWRAALNSGYPVGFEPVFQRNCLSGLGSAWHPCVSHGQPLTVPSGWNKKHNILTTVIMWKLTLQLNIKLWYFVYRTNSNLKSFNLRKFIFPLRVIVSREVANSTWRKNPHTPVHGVKEFCRILLSPFNLHPSKLHTSSLQT